MNIATALLSLTALLVTISTALVGAALVAAGRADRWAEGSGPGNKSVNTCYGDPADAADGRADQWIDEPSP